ncbi:MAG: putative quinol monooxygenase [Arenibacterium sp.]
MQILMAIIRAKPGAEETVRRALLAVGDYARAHEPGTIGFHVAQDPDDPCRFTTYERFENKDAMAVHNNGPGSKGFFETAGNMLDGDVTVVTAEEIFTL